MMQCDIGVFTTYVHGTKPPAIAAPLRAVTLALNRLGVIETDGDAWFSSGIGLNPVAQPAFP